MDALTRAAVAGTSREKPPASGLPTDDLFEGAANTNPERELLLRAGARAVYQAAGRTPETGVAPPEPAPEESLPACSAEAAEVIRSLLAGQRDAILREALERLRLAGLRLPHALLPDALNMERKVLRPIVAVLGERGRWLAGFNPGWASATVSESGRTEEYEEVAWEEGTLPERLDAIRRFRGRDADQGRLMVEDVWKSEKADARAALVAALEIGLSSDDESFLERALNDRSVRVREVAADLLPRLSGSAYVERAMARADAVLVGYEAPARGLLGRRRTGKLIVTPPEEVDGSWRRDLPGEKPSHGVGEKAWMISQALSVVPPGHWERRFGINPSEMIVAARGEWEAALLAGWCRSTGLHGDESWALPLWRRCYESFEEGGEYAIAWGYMRLLTPLLPQSDLAAALRELLRDDEMTVRMIHTLDALPGPWDHELGLWYLEALRDRVRNVFSNPSDANDYWPGTLASAAERLPPSCFRYAPGSPPDIVQSDPEGEGFQIVRREPYQISAWRQELEKFDETLELRRRLVKEIPL